jgi:hypothetical protein
VIDLTTKGTKNHEKRERMFTAETLRTQRRTVVKSKKQEDLGITLSSPISYPRKPYYHLSHIISINIFLLSFLSINDNKVKAYYHFRSTSKGKKAVPSV